MRRSGNTVLANPVLVGAVTVLVTLVAVFLAYNANNGLPFVPTTELKVQLPNGANLVRGNEVRSGGFRVGVISTIEPIALQDGTAGAELTLKLDKSLGEIPADSSVTVRPRSALGLKYVELTEGKSTKGFEDGDTVPVNQTRLPVDLDRVFEMFDEPTRKGSQVNLQGFGDAFSGRGKDLNRTIEELPRTLTHLEPVMATLSDDQTELRNFFKNLGRTATEVRPVSRTNAKLFTKMADTFAAIGRDETRLKEFISKSPPTLDVSTDSLKVQRPFLSDLADFSEDLKPATAELRAALPTINVALKSGVGVQRRLVATNEQLQTTMSALRDFSGTSSTGAALRGLTGTVTTLNPQLRFYGPFVTVCNYWNVFWTQVAEHFAEPDTTGNAQRALINSVGRQTDSLGSMGATHPANGQGVNNPDDVPQFFQGPVYTHAVMPDGSADCEQGQRGFVYRNARYAPPEYHIQADPRTKGAQGPTWTGRARVPEGQTFTFKPETGPNKDLFTSETGDE